MHFDQWKGKRLSGVLDEGLTGLLFTFQLKRLHVVENLSCVGLDRIHVYYFQYLLTAYRMPNTLLAGCFLSELIIYFRDWTMGVI